MTVVGSRAGIRIVNTASLAVSASLVFVFLCTLPSWFEQVFAHSSTVGINQANAIEAGRQFSCRASFSLILMIVTALLAWLIRFGALRISSATSHLLMGAFRAGTEILIIGVLTWAVFAFAWVPTEVIQEVRDHASKACQS